MSLAQLSEELTGWGRPILPSGLHKIETGERRVDVDDLVALAWVLGVSPVRLLLPVDEPETPEAGEPVDLLHGPQPGSVSLTGSLSMPWQGAWEWACGDEPPGGIDRFEDWEQENRPHARRRVTTHELQRLANSARDAGLALERAALLLQRAAGSEADAPPSPDQPQGGVAESQAEDPFARVLREAFGQGPAPRRGRRG